MTYAKADPHDLLMSVSVTNAGPDADTLHVLPTAWYRNTWAWDEGAAKPELRVQGEARLVTEHPFLGRLEILSDRSPTVLFCENDTNVERLFGSPSATRYPKDGINDHVVDGQATVAADSGTKAAFWHRLTIAPGATATIRIPVSWALSSLTRIFHGRAAPYFSIAPQKEEGAGGSPGPSGPPVSFLRFRTPESGP